MLWDAYINSYKEEKTKVIFLKYYVHNEGELVFRFNKDACYTLPKVLAEKLETDGVCALQSGTKKEQ